MKILLAHSHYNSEVPSGENKVFASEKSMLISQKHEVEEFCRYSDEIRKKGVTGKIQGALSTPWNPWMAQAIKRKAESFKPDIVHVHNTFPLLSPSLFHSLNKISARVLTLHNYRIFCPAGIPIRAGKICTECIDRKSPLSSIRYGCYRNSRIATLPLALNVSLQKLLRTWDKQVDAFIVLSEYQREVMIKVGLPEKKIHIKPNFSHSSTSITPWPKRDDYVVFAGRLSAEKGIVNLIRAWQSWGNSAPELRLIGDGELRSKLEQMATGLPIRFLGQLDSKETHAQLAAAKLSILPSECLETFGLVIVESFSHGTPVATSNLGPLPAIVQSGHCGIVFEPANPFSLLEKVRSAWEAPELLEQMGKHARTEFENKYTEEANYASLMEIYRKAIEVSHNG